VSIVTAGTVLVLADVRPVDGPESALAARVCAAINLLDPEPPLAIVAEGEEALLLPAIALSQRSAHRRVSGYLLIEPVLPTVTDTWPDAPVTVASDDPSCDASMQGRLRGWTVVMRGAVVDWPPVE
jgi:hypothetical protein